MTDKTKIDFSSVLASSVHDMKNSLCLLIQSIDNLSEANSNNNPETADQLAKLHYEASRLNTNLLQLLSIFRAEKQQLPINIEEHYISDLIEEVLAKNELYLSNYKIDVKIEIEPELAWFLDVDLVGNLLNDIFINAMRYTHHKILISAWIKDNKFNIKIEDDGKGYPDSMLELIDKPMQDFNLSTGRTGLGLFFAKLIAEAHQNKNEIGKINLCNGGQLGGSVFTLTLP